MGIAYNFLFLIIQVRNGLSVYALHSYNFTTFYNRNVNTLPVRLKICYEGSPY